MAEDFKALGQIIRSVVVTSKTPLTLYEVNRDYRQVEEEDIPFRQHQYRSLEELLRKVPGLNVFQQAGKTVVHIIPNESNAHIAKMVSAQKPPKKKPPRSTNYNRYGGNSRRPSYFNNYPRTDVNRNNVQNKNPYQGSQFRVNSVNGRPNLAEISKRSEPQASPAPATQRSSSQSSSTSRWSPPASRKPAVTQATQQGTSSGWSPRPKSPTQQPARAPVAAQPARNEPPMRHPKETSPTPPRPPTPPPTVTPPAAVIQKPAPVRQRLDARPEVSQSAPELPRSRTVPAKSALQRSTSNVESAVSKPQQQQSEVRSSVPRRLNVTWEDEKSSMTTSSVQQRLNIPSPIQVESKPRQAEVPHRTSAVSQRQLGGLAPQSRHGTADDPRLRLNSWTASRHLPFAFYKEVPTKGGFLCSVTVNSKKYSSYPKEAKTAEEAEILAAQAALDALSKDDQSSKAVTYDRNLLTKRILKIVAEHPTGIFEKHVQEFYMLKFNEKLPSGWLKIIENEVMIEAGANHLSILSPMTDAPLRRPSSPPASPRVDPESLKLNYLTEFAVHIYAAYSTTELWGVIIDSDHSDQICELADRMEQHYTGDITQPTSITPGKHYAMFDEAWHRVRCVGINSEMQTATVFFIDRGDEDTCDFSKMRPLHPEFCQLPAQAVRLSLNGLEVFESFDGIQAMLDESLVDQDVSVVKVSEGSHSNMISAQLYLEVGNVAVDVNSTLQCEILKKLDPANLIATEKSAQDVHISHVGAKAIYVQVIRGLQILQTLMKDFEDCIKGPDFKPKPIAKFSMDCMYATKLVNENSWRRVKVTRVRNEDEAEVLSVDEGNSFLVKRKDLISLKDFPSLLSVYPCQASLVRLHKISPVMFDQKMSEQLRKLAPKTDIFFMKVVGNHEKIPVVEIYQRTEKNLLASLNDTLALEPEIISKADETNNVKSRLRSSIGVRSEFPLKSPHIPANGEYFDVRVTMSAHPGNFTVQPLNHSKDLDEMMDKLSNVCSTYSGPSLTPGSVKAGNMYAAKYDDGRWYRAYISRVISDTVFAVYFCDYGDYNAVSIQNLQPLQNQFYDLPYQAIKAKLHGVTPKLDDWTVKDSLRFGDLTVERNFVSIVKYCDVDNNSNGETILSLELIDVSSDEDIYISQKLIEEHRAEKVTN